MNWINIETTTLDSEEFVGSDPVARATWLCLFRYCAGQENGGVILGCKSWGDRKWQQLARVTQAEVFAESALWIWEGENLHLWQYPADKEAEVKQRRDRARTNGQRGGRPAANPEAKDKKPTSDTQTKPTLVDFAKAEGEREGEGERKENNTFTPPGAEEKAKKPKPRKSPDLELAADAPTPPIKRQRDLILDALATVGGGKPEEVTHWGTAVAAKAAIIAVTPDVTPEEIQRRARNYRTHFESAALTPTALSKHWAVCSAPRANVGGRINVDQADSERAAAGGQFSWEKGKGF